MIMERLVFIRMQPLRILLLEGAGEVLRPALAEAYPMAEFLDARDVSQAGSVDLLVANLVLPWCAESVPTLAAWRHVLRPEGVVMVTLLGPDTLQEMRPFTTKSQLLDMHLLGDALVQAGFQTPVLDVEFLTLLYRDEKKCLQEMQEAGLLAEIPETVSWQQDEEGRIPLSIEMVFAHAFCPVGSMLGVDGEVSVPLSKILRRKAEIL